MSDNMCAFFIQAILVMGLAFGVSSALGVASEVAGNAVLIASGHEGYTSPSIAASIGFRGGSSGYIVGVGCCIGIIMYSRTARYLPLITSPFLIMAGALTGVVGYESLADSDDISWVQDVLKMDGFGSDNATRAGAVGGAVVGGGLLLILQICVCGYVIWEKGSKLYHSRIRANQSATTV